eukprot:6185301-Pleurochrysis_carterae.AAC.5
MLIAAPLDTERAAAAMPARAESHTSVAAGRKAASLSPDTLDARLVGGLVVLSALRGRRLGRRRLRLLNLLRSLLRLGTLLHLTQSSLTGRSTNLWLLITLRLNHLERSTHNGLGSRLIHLPRLLASRLLKGALLVHPAVHLGPSNLARVQALRGHGLHLAVDELERALVGAHEENAMARINLKAAKTAGLSLDNHGPEGNEQMRQTLAQQQRTAL